MAVNDGTSTELFPGWSSVVHQPCEEPEESELPSTVDMAAFTTGLSSVETNAASQNTTHSDSDSDSDVDSSNSGSDISQSCSQSDSSDSDSSSSSPGTSSRSQSPEFSVTSSQTNALRFKITAVRKSTDEKPGKLSDSNNTTSTKGNLNSKSASSSSESPCSTESESDTDLSRKSAPVPSSTVVTRNSAVAAAKNSVIVKSAKESTSASSTSARKVVSKTRTKVPDKKVVKKEHAAKSKSRLRPRRTRKMASLPLSRGSTYSSSDSDESEADSVMLASCSLQEIRQEDLAAILPDQQECDAFGDFECDRTDKNSPQTGDMSGSDMELPQQAVNALIQRTTESSSESESHPPPNPNSLYANSLLQQFVAQTQMLNAPCPNISQFGGSGGDGAKLSTSTVSGAATENDKSELEPKRRRRGRPKKNESSKEKTEYCTNPNVSPDSGIQNSPDHISSPEPPNMKNQKPVKDKSNKNVKKCDKIKENHPVINKSLSSLNKIICANTDRVLYPPRRKVGRPPTSTRKGPGRPPKAKPEASKDKSSQSKPAKSNRPVLVAKNTLAKNKIVAIRNAKLMHTKNKHKHKKHKKYKFKTLKQPTNVIDPKITIDIEKLIADFMKQCVIGSIKVSKPKENLPEILKTLKKVSKKRKTTEEKKKKKQSVNTTETKPNSNDQRLPLKKRHYHISVNESNQICEEEKPSKVETKPKQSMTQSSNNQKQEHTLQTNINNNEYEGSKDHIDEAIEACINRFTDEAKTVKEAVEIKEEKLNSSNGSITATTPKKRHRLEMTAEKVVPTLKLESPADDNDDKSSAKITVESYITELKIKRNLLTKPTDDIKSESGALDLPPETQQSVKVVPELTKKKVRKRRAINRTGFPTVKRKKKKLPPPVAPVAPIIEPVCDRVPKDGEEYTDFLERNEHVEDCGMKFDTSRTDPSKWDSISDCESLPLDERIDFELDDLKPDKMTLRQRDSSPATSVDTKSSVCKFDDADLDEISLESSIERLRSRLEKKRKRALEKSLENLNGYPKRRLRDVSPASSIEPIMERRLRDERASASGDEMKKCKKVPRWRKKYLLAGLFSDYFKEDDEATRLRRTENAVKSRLNYVPAEHPYGLLPPPYHCGKYLRNRKLAFHLPYDLWWQHTHSQLPGRDIVPSWNYRKIRTNVYNVKISTGACEPQSCNCKATQNCGDDCINRLVLSECPASHRCQNQKIQRHEWSPGLEKFMTEAKGWGVRTKLPIKSSDFILEYVGEVVSDQEFKERMGTIYGNDNHHYCLHLDGGLVIDGHRMGGDGRFVNHSCQPNCEMQKWSVNGQFRMALFALRDIEGGEELTYDYNFSLFNAAEGQECKCGSEMCRGVIGGKSQRVRQLPAAENAVNKHPGRVGRPRKTEAKKKASNNKESAAQQSVPSLVNIQVKPMSHQQKCFILEHHCFLLRNLTKVRKVRDRSVSTSRQQTATPTDHSSNFMNHLNALQKPRNMKTRRLAQAEDDPELNKTLKIASVLKEIMLIIMSAKDEKDDELLSTNFTTVPSKRKVPDYYTCITDPIDLSTIEQNIATGIYKTPNQFDSDMNRVFNNYIRFYGRSSDIGVNATKLKKIYMESKHKNLSKFENVLGEKPPPNFVFDKKKNEEEDIIRCICGIPRDEGLMIQCERCMVWQHCECVKADESAPSYHCEICIPRKVDYEIPMDEFTEHGHQYYMTLLRGDLQLRQGDTVYVLRDIPIPNSDRKHTYDTIGTIDYNELDIFRIERLWIDKETGKRLAYGHHYLRPHETYHEPTRKFFPNEVMRVPLYEAVPVELIIRHCWVLDINTYRKGRPIGAPEDHLYICEYRVDKSARLFSKVSKNKFPCCTKSFAFEKFETPLKISRTYTPHDLDPILVKPRGRKAHDHEEPARETLDNATVAPPIVRTPGEQKARLNKILLSLLGKMPTKNVVDVSYLLEGSRRRKKQTDCVKSN